MSKNIIGIDPGLTGAVVIRTCNGGVIIEDTPVNAVKKGKGTKLEYIPYLMAGCLKGFDPKNTHVYIEAVHSMPKQGVASTFTFGKGYGIWIGIIAAYDLPHTFVTPQKWKKEMMAGFANKDDARIRAVQLYPHLASAMKLKKHIGRADALLIMEYGVARSNGLGY